MSTVRGYGRPVIEGNAFCSVVIRQKREAPVEGEIWVVIPVQNAESIAQAIIDEANKIMKARGSPAHPGEGGRRRGRPYLRLVVP